MKSRKRVVRFSITWALAAELDLRDIVAFVRIHEVPGRALRVLRQLRARATTLAASPDRGRWVPELDRELGTRICGEVLEGPWRIMYRVEGREVLVVRVIDGRRNVEDLLLRSLLR